MSTSLTAGTSTLDRVGEAVHGAALKYRADVDGLRAIAILSVLLYHAFPQWVPGGFVGVDIFFVISGYLITGIIGAEIQRGDFSIRSFYARRIKRIFPALILVLCFALIMGWLTLTSSEYRLLQKHARGAIGFVSNFWYLNESLAYFDPSAGSKILLHLWSLSVEEQYYIVWPLVLFLALKLGRGPFRRSAIVAAGLVGLASVICSMVLTSRNLSASFYLPQARAWELLAGSALAIALSAGGAQPRKFQFTPRLRLAAAGAGLALMLGSLFLIKRAEGFPWPTALLPVLGATLMILAGPGNWLNDRILANRVSVQIGLISYPLYLWHWPLLSFAFIFNAGHTSGAARVGLLLLSAALAWLTYETVEKPVRRSRNNALMVSMLVGGMVAMLLACFAIKSHKGFPDRPISQMLNGDPASIASGADSSLLIKGDCGMPDADRWDLSCYSGSPLPPAYLVFGDSKAEALYYGFVREASDKRWGLISSVGLPGINAADKNIAAFDFVLKSKSVHTVVLTTALRSMFPVDPESGFIVQPAPQVSAKAYDDFIQPLEAAGKKIVIVMDNPTLPDPTECIEGNLTSMPLLDRLLFRKMNSYCRLRYSDHLAGTREYRELLIGIKARHPQVVLVDLSDYLCDKQTDLCPITREGKFLYAYSDHISDYANSRIAKEILPMLGDSLPAEASGSR